MVPWHGESDDRGTHERRKDFRTLHCTSFLMFSRLSHRIRPYLYVSVYVTRGTRNEAGVGWSVTKDNTLTDTSDQCCKPGV